MTRFSIQHHYAALQPLIALTEGIQAAGRLEPALAELVLMRVSQINGCAFCLDMHSKDARAAGETEQRLHLLPAWRETRLYSARERAALAWAEALTTLGSADAVPDALYAEVRGQFEEAALVDLTLVVVAINGFNRLNIAARTVGGSYKPAAH
ncbi:MAG TPA: carboxymuconolactone decarboxylase family protein [Luteimonas sp.]|nr:carboxymuconolactone decarboxylase family protein [Luteimonas sp.]